MTTRKGTVDRTVVAYIPHDDWHTVLCADGSIWSWNGNRWGKDVPALPAVPSEIDAERKAGA